MPTQEEDSNVSPARWAELAEEEDYLVEWDDCEVPADTDDGSRGGYDDQTLDEITRLLRRRGLTLVADDTGLVVKPS